MLQRLGRRSLLSTQFCASSIALYPRFCSSDARKLILIGLSGKRRAGKDQAADVLLKQISKTSMRSRWFSKQSIGYFPKKEYCEESKADLERLLKDDNLKEKHRAGIIEIASKGRETNPLVWVDKCYSKIMKDFDESYASKGICFIPDVRFRNEVDYLIAKQQLIKRAKSFECIDVTVYMLRIHACDAIRKERGWVYQENIDTHASEKELDNLPGELWEYQFFNDDNDLKSYILGLLPLLIRLEEFVRTIE